MFFFTAMCEMKNRNDDDEALETIKKAVEKMLDERDEMMKELLKRI